ncbi:MAG: ABC transporter permease [Prochlorotrichaceae cyanobacterium]|jgi:putative ABC transport system permease protein
MNIEPFQLLLATSLIIVNIGLSIVLKLQLTRSLVVASLRMVIQLFLIGYILQWLFNQDNPILILMMGLIMTGIAGFSAVDRTKRYFSGLYWNSFISILASATIVTGLAVSEILQVSPWYNPQYLIPLLGMVLGNALNGIYLGVDRFMETVISDQEQIELLLILGATRWEAAQSAFQDAMRTGMTPIINSMLVTGLVSLPGMMTGQILAGASPIQAVRYQIVIMFMIAAAVALGTLGVVTLAFFQIFSAHHYLHRDRILTR